MITLGINFSHDASMCLIQDGKIIAALEEEKASRLKQDFGWPEKAIEILFKKNNIKAGDIDQIAFGSMFYSSIGRNEIKYRFSKNKSDKNKEIIDRLTSYLNLSQKKIGDDNIKVFEAEIRKRGFINAELEFYNHHLSHASSAFYCAPFVSDLVITCDGHGDGEAFNFYRVASDGKLELVKLNDHSVSIGQFYSAITKYLGFRPTRHEGKITGLAAYGKPSELVDKFMALYYYEGENLRRFPHGLEKEYWKENKLDSKLSAKQKINLNHSESDIGAAYSKNAIIIDDWLEKVCANHSKEDIAYACQYVSEQVIINEVGRVVNDNFPNPKLKISLAGGVFANVRINQMIYEQDYCENIFIQPAMGDSGLAMGAAILSQIKNNRNLELGDRSFVFKNTYWGPDYSDTVDEFVSSIDTNHYHIEKMENPAQRIAEKLAANKIVGFWNGAMEWGPRALGSRSILLNTFDKSVNDSLNKRLNRTEFMPFAPVVLDNAALTYFPAYDKNVPAANYMTITYDVKKEYHEMLQATVHVDGTARPQVIDRSTQPYYYDILTEFFKLTDCAALVNTSFNAHEEPIVSNPATAFNALKTDRIDILVLDNYLIESR
ncbi:MAG: carbamoyltransferase C-terminal domain-containing protein [Cytophagales bacterium]